MTMPNVSMRQLLEAGVHFGHHSRRWNPRMKDYIFGVRNGIHIIDLQKSLPMFDQGLRVLRDVAAEGGRILFVGTKRQARDKVAEAAKKCGQYYVNQRWLGGMMTNWQTISNSINRLAEIEEILGQEETGLTKKEMLQLSREQDKLESSIGGIRGMGGLPDALFIIDTNKEDIAVAEARKLNIPTVAIIDTNSDPNVVDYPMPGNDDAMRAIDLYCDLAASAILDGIQAELTRSGKDIGADVEPPSEELPESKSNSKNAGEKTEAKTAKKSDGKSASSKKSDTKETKAKDEKKPEDEKKSDAKKSDAKAKDKTDDKEKKSDDSEANGDEQKKAASAG